MKRTGKGSAGGLIFIFAFVAVGTAPIYLYLADLINWARMQKWKEVPAIIRSADLSAGRTTGGKSTVYRALAVYEYEYMGRKYTSSKVSRYFGRDNMGDFHEDIYDELIPFKNSGRPFRCYVNPNSPDQAILYRKVRLSMLCLFGGLGGVFGGIGYGMLAGYLASYIREKRASTFRKRYPAEPWKCRPDWSRGECQTSAGTKMFVAIAISILAAIFSIPILLFIPGELSKGNYAALWALIFPFLGLVVIKWGIDSILQWIRFGRAVLKLNKVPVRPGERLQGTIQTSANLPQSAEVTIKLMYRGDAIRTSENEKTRTNPFTGADGKTFIQVDVQIPANAKTGKESDNWELNAIAKIPGIDFDATFGLPIFRGS